MSWIYTMTMMFNKHKTLRCWCLDSQMLITICFKFRSVCVLKYGECSLVTWNAATLYLWFRRNSDVFGMWYSWHIRLMPMALWYNLTEYVMLLQKAWTISSLVCVIFCYEVIEFSPKSQLAVKLLWGDSITFSMFAAFGFI